MGLWETGSEPSCKLGVGRAAGSSSRVLISAPVWGPFCRDRGVTGSFLAMSSIEMSSKLPSSRRGTRHLQSSCTAWHSIPRGIPDCMAHCWRAWVSATISFCHVTWMSWQPSNGGGRKSPHLNTPRLCFSTWAMGSLKAVACLLARDLTWVSLRGLAPWWWRTQNSHQLSGIFLHFLM